MQIRCTCLWHTVSAQPTATLITASNSRPQDETREMDRDRVLKED